MKKKKILSVILAATVLTGSILGITTAVRATTSSGTVTVYRGDDLNYNFYYWNDSSTYGTVTSDVTQNVYLNDSETVLQVYVTEGQEVKEGDVLMEFDTVQTGIGLEKEKLKKQQIELDIEVAQTNLDTLNRLYPYVEPSADYIPEEEPEEEEDEVDEASIRLEMIALIEESSLPDELKEELNEILSRDSSTDEETVLSDAEVRKLSDALTRLQQSNKDEDRKALASILKTLHSDTLRSVIADLWRTSESEQATEEEKKAFRDLFGKLDADVVRGILQAVMEGDGIPADAKRQILLEILDLPDDPGEDTELTFDDVLDYLNAHVDTFDEATRKMLIEMLGGTIDTPDNSGGDEDTDNDESDSTDIPSEDDGISAGEGETVSFVDEGIHVFADYRTWKPSVSFLLADTSAGSGLISSGAQYSAEELQRAKTEEQQKLDALQIDRKESELRIAQTEEALSEGVIRAKMNGIVRSLKDVENPPTDGSAFLIVSGTKGLYIQSAVSESNLNQLHEGDLVTVTSWQSGNVYDAIVKDISPYPDTSGTFSSDSADSYYPFTAYIDSESADLQEGEHLQVSMTFTVIDESASGDGFYLYKPFIRDENGQKYVYIRDEEGRLQKQYVTVGSYNGSGYEILSGVTSENWFAFPYGNQVKEGAATREGTLDELYGS